MLNIYYPSCEAAAAANSEVDGSTGKALQLAASLMNTGAFDDLTIFEQSAPLYTARRHEEDHIISMRKIDDVVVQDQPDVVRTSLLSKGFNSIKTNIERIKVICSLLDVLQLLGSEKLTKAALNLTAQLTGCLIAYFANSNNSGSSDGRLPKTLLYSAAAANTVGFLGSCAGIALRDKEPRAASIIGGIGTMFVAATFMMVMGTFIPNN